MVLKELLFQYSHIVNQPEKNSPIITVKYTLHANTQKKFRDPYSSLLELEYKKNF